MVGTEMSPLARVGRLGDALAGLAARLQERGHEVSVILPLYRLIRERYRPGPTGVTVNVALDHREAEAAVHEWSTPEGVQVFLIRRDAYFDRTGIYGANGHDAYDDNLERFTFFARAAVKLILHLDPQPEVLHLHDWPTALIPALVRARGLPFPTVLSIHDAAFQGIGPAADFSFTHLPWEWFGPGGFEYHGMVNLLKGGVAAADRVAVCGALTPQRLQRPEGGHGLDGFFRAHARKLVGVPEGLEPLEPAPAGQTKGEARAALLEEYGLSAAPAGPVLLDAGNGARPPLADRLLSADIRVLATGGADATGEAALQRAWQVALRRHRGKIALVEGWTPSLLRGVDAVVFPGEPEEALLIAALRAGVVPVVRATPGVYSLVRGQGGAGEEAVLFHDDTPEAFADALKRMLRLFGEESRWAAMATKAAQQAAEDFSHEAMAARYELLYRSVAQTLPVS